MTFSHYSAFEISRIDSVAQVEWTEPYPGLTYRFEKPKGIWLSVDGADDWPQFCKDADFRLNMLKVRHIVTLRPDARILKLSTANDIYDFTRRYDARLDRIPVIDWRRVASEWQGIVIAPYIYECRMEMATSWYYPWDCASGVIWDAAAVESIAVDRSWSRREALTLR
jgi:hypothetical protein